MRITSVCVVQQMLFQMLFWLTVKTAPPIFRNQIVSLALTRPAVQIQSLNGVCVCVSQREGSLNQVLVCIPICVCLGCRVGNYPPGDQTPRYPLSASLLQSQLIIQSIAGGQLGNCLDRNLQPASVHLHFEQFVMWRVQQGVCLLCACVFLCRTVTFVAKVQTQPQL